MKQRQLKLADAEAARNFASGRRQHLRQPTRIRSRDRARVELRLLPDEPGDNERIDGNILGVLLEGLSVRQGIGEFPEFQGGVLETPTQEAGNVAFNGAQCRTILAARLRHLREFHSTQSLLGSVANAES